MVELPRDVKAKRAIRRFWVAGTAGAFLSALSRNLPLDIQTVSSTPDWPYTLDLFLRYGYAWWLLVYFFMSSFSTEEEVDHLKKDLMYDVVQSVFSLGAIYCLGFVSRDSPDLRHHWFIGYLGANAAIFLIGGLSLAMFHDDKTEWINALRLSAAVIAAIGMGVSIADGVSGASPSGMHLLRFAGLQALLWMILLCYCVLRWKRGPIYETTAPMPPATKEPEPAPAAPVVLPEAKPESAAAKAPK
jgi:hypothetical protein